MGQQSIDSDEFIGSAVDLGSDDHSSNLRLGASNCYILPSWDAIEHTADLPIEPPCQLGMQVQGKSLVCHTSGTCHSAHSNEHLADQYLGPDPGKYQGVWTLIYRVFDSGNPRMHHWTNFPLAPMCPILPACIRVPHTPGLHPCTPYSRLAPVCPILTACTRVPHTPGLHPRVPYSRLAPVCPILPACTRVPHTLGLRPCAPFSPLAPVCPILLACTHVPHTLGVNLFYLTSHSKFGKGETQSNA